MSDVTLYDFNAEGYDPGNWLFVGGAASWGESTFSACDGGSVTPHTSTHFITAAKVPRSVDGESYRDYDVSEYDSSIDAGDVDYDMSYYGAGGSPDHVGIAMEFYDGGMSIIGSRVGTTISDPNCTWTAYSDIGDVPANTRTIRVLMLSPYVAGSYANGYFDDVLFTITGITAAPIPSEATALYPEAVVGVGQTLDTKVTSLRAGAIIGVGATSDSEVTQLKADAVILWDPSILPPQYFTVVNMTW